MITHAPANRRICVVTGTRADYGLLRPVLRAIQAEPSLSLSVLATGAHFSHEFGLTYREIERDGFPLSAKVEMLVSSDSPVGIAKSLGLAVIGCAEAFERIAPDLVLVLGDRYEVLAAVEAALFARIPVGHIAGGDISEGAYDEAIRHSVTKMSHLHFVTNADSARRVRQLGEDERRIHVVGSPGIDGLLQTPFLDRQSLESALGFSFRRQNLLLTFHPTTLSENSATHELHEVFSGIDRLGPDIGVLITKPNADVGGRGLFPVIDRYVDQRPNTKAFVTMGQLNYLSTMAQVDAVVGNSSSGLYEAPSLRKPTVNIGDRQKGRLRAASVIDCEVEAGAVAQAIARALKMDCRNVENPYGNGDAAPRIVQAICKSSDLKGLIRKEFKDVP